MAEFVAVLVLLGIAVGAGWNARRLIRRQSGAGGRTSTSVPSPGAPMAAATALPPVVARAWSILDLVFSGRHEVTVAIHPDTVSYHEAVSGAQARGYALTSETPHSPDGTIRTVVFTRVA